MTEVTNTLEDLRLLREARLPAGFEERLRERLAVAAGDRTVVRFRSRKRHHALLLLAAIALPVAAFAAGGVFLSQRNAKSVKPAASAVEIPNALEKASPSSKLPAIAPTASEQKETDISVDSPQPLKDEHDSSKRINPIARASSAPATVTSRPTTKRSSKVVPTPTTLAPMPAVNRAPANIESLDVSVPKRTGSTRTVGSEGATATSSDLRTSTEQGSANLARFERENGKETREQAALRRGSDAAQQSKERVQARVRVRKGQ